MVTIEKLNTVKCKIISIFSGMKGKSMELRNLKTFQVVAQHLNMTKAAKILGYTQPTITLQIQVLERELGHSLFTRIGKNTFLTPAGKKLQKHTDKLFNVVEELERDLEELNGPSGRLSIAASEYYCSHYLSILVNAYINLHPQVKLKLIPSNSLDVIEKILSNEADIGIIACECNHKDIESHVLGEERAVLVVAAEILKDNTKERILEKYPFLAFHGNCSFDTLIKQCFSEMNYRPASIIEFGGSDETIRRAVLNQTGIALLGENVIKEELANGLLVPLHYCTQTIETSLIYLKTRTEGATINSFSDLLKDAWVATT
ncbi:LysR family transcriptional regulator [Peribacillus frigoritolerans]|uniref:LysR family transcriptional regulator n=1 Tax=Peribacillus frigoritolerans TaxID=450367 RepID=UPI0021D39C19|nr:LysR family transcriptional regulator [Peribacillus frigoritolerans]MCU6600138.1 LysR family transcriptional regulator [Peribacillus frigoritolerans]